MNELHLAYLSLGSNIEPEVNLPKAVRLLSEHGSIQKISSVWESESVGAEGPNYLNLCLSFQSVFARSELIENILHPIEAQLGRRRGANKFAPRTMDIDVVIFDGEVVSGHWLTQAFVVVPLAEIFPEFKPASNHETIQETATRLRRDVWMETRRGVLG